MLTSSICLHSKLSNVSEPSFFFSSRVMKPCLRRSSTRSWTWCSCSCPSTVWRSWTSTPPTARACCRSTSPSWPTTCPWQSCCCELVPRRVLTVSVCVCTPTIRSRGPKLVTWVDFKTLSVKATNEIIALNFQFLGTLGQVFFFFLLLLHFTPCWNNTNWLQFVIFWRLITKEEEWSNRLWQKK